MMKTTNSPYGMNYKEIKMQELRNEKSLEENNMLLKEILKELKVLTTYMSKLEK
ncbi:MAG: hypothetical protein N4A54_02065 [Peptostreptococcaceae bacterium]|jgi:hypothetical protein|nr:hypothetical protein [Peptostreptococcaceae bacterium]